MSTAPLTLTPQHTTALRQLADIFQSSTSIQEQTVAPHPQAVPWVPRSTTPPRVSHAGTTPSTSADPTDPNRLRMQCHVHSRRTRNNTPIEETTHDTCERRDTTTHPKHPTPQRNYITQDDTNAIHNTQHKLFTHSTSTPCNITNTALYHVAPPTQLPQHIHTDKINKHTTRTYMQRRRPPHYKETITKYETLANDPTLQGVWTQAMCRELGRLAQGWDGSSGTNTIFFMTHGEIKQIPRDRTVTYACIVVDYRPQKYDPNRVRITVSGNLINYPGELTTRTADLTTAIILWNSTISTPGARFACADIENMYLQTPMDRYEYMQINAALIPAAFMDTYKLCDKIYNGQIYMEIRRA
eukprot:CCRYP_009660-RA/>CCRYP_009660-RA protein AED:0.41 eAED:0.41 QI:0/0/0/1/0/0/2/0/355